MISPEEVREIRRQVSALADLVGRLQVRLMKLELRESVPAIVEKYGVGLPDSQAAWKEWYG